MATFSTIASGSTGNCALLTDEHTHILIDAGISLRRIRGALREMALTPDNLSAVLVTQDVYKRQVIVGLGKVTTLFSVSE